MIDNNFGGIRDPLKQNLVPQFCRNRNKDVSILTVTEADTDPKGRLVSFKVTPSNDRVFCVCALGIALGYSCLEGVSLKDYKIIWKIKMREMKTKYYLETLLHYR